MVYEKNLSNYFQFVFESPAIKEIIDNKVAGISEEFLVTKLKERANQIWNVANKQIYDLSLLEVEQEKKVRELKDLSPPKKPGLIEIFEIIEPLKIWLVALIVGILTICRYLNIITLYIGVLLLGIFILLIYVLNTMYKNRLIYYQDEVKTIQSTKRDELGINKLNDEIELLIKNINDEISKKLLEESSLIINEQMKNFSELLSDINLPRLDAPGLAELYEKDYVISTRSKDKLEKLIRNVRGGSIGVAGPRGVGKTVLLRSICEEFIISNRKMLSIFTSAPVEYVARDFILNLFSLIIKKSLKISNLGEKSPFDRPNTLKSSTPTMKYIRCILSHLSGETMAFFYLFGLILVICGLFLTQEIASIDKPIKELETLGVNTGSFLVYGYMLIVLATIFLYVHRANQLRIHNNNKLFDPKKLIKFLRFTPYNIIAKLIIPSLISFSGIIFIIISMYIKLYSVNIDVQTSSTKYIYSYLIILGISADKLLLFGIILAILGIVLNYTYEIISDYISSEALNFEKEKNDLDDRESRWVQKSQEWLTKIRFQQSYSSGWSGSLKLPGLEGGFSTLTSAAENQMSFPEIVHNYREYVEELAKEFDIIIGIDELDKLKSDEDAQRFLNEIKAIFGLKNVFYLISVSENAMSNFERRGLPFRDAFDSSFDTIVYVDYFDQESSLSLIWKRVIGFPIPLFCLDYCLAGGLARDLIRTCRNMLDFVPIGETRTLSQISKFVIETDLRAKLKAISISAKKISSKSDSIIIFEEIHKIEKICDLWDLNGFWNYLDTNIWSCSARVCGIESKDKSKEVSKEHIESDSIMEELITYLYYSLTLLEFFQDSNKYVINKNFDEGKFNLLAKSRQCMAINSCISNYLINEFRLSNNMKMPSILSYNVSDNNNNRT